MPWELSGPSCHCLTEGTERSLLRYEWCDYQLREGLSPHLHAPHRQLYAEEFYPHCQWGPDQLLLPVVSTGQHHKHIITPKITQIQPRSPLGTTGAYNTLSVVDSAGGTEISTHSSPSDGPNCTCLRPHQVYNNTKEHQSKHHQHVYPNLSHAAFMTLPSSYLQPHPQHLPAAFAPPLNSSLQ